MQRMVRGRWVRAALAALLLLVLGGLPGCSRGVEVVQDPSTTSTGAPSTSRTSSGTPTPTTAPSPDLLRVAISFDQPGLGLKEGDEYSGLDVDVARYVAERLGARRLEFIRAVPGQRETLLATGQADMVISAYSMTPERARKVSFAGPYLVTGQGLLVQRRSAVRSLDQLSAFTVCGAEGSSSVARLVDDHPGLHILTKPTVTECVDALRAGTVKAVTSDMTALAGYLGPEQPRPALRLVGRPLGTESYGIGLPLDDPELCTQVSDALREMIASGEWRAAVAANLPSAKVIGSQTYRAPKVRTCRARSSSSSGATGDGATS